MSCTSRRMIAITNNPHSKQHIIAQAATKQNMKKAPNNSFIVGVFFMTLTSRK